MIKHDYLIGMKNDLFWLTWMMCGIEWHVWCLYLINMNKIWFDMNYDLIGMIID